MSCLGPVPGAGSLLQAPHRTSPGQILYLHVPAAWKQALSHRAVLYMDIRQPLTPRAANSGSQGDLQQRITPSTVWIPHHSTSHRCLRFDLQMWAFQTYELHLCSRLMPGMLNLPQETTNRKSQLFPAPRHGLCQGLKNDLKSIHNPHALNQLFRGNTNPKQCSGGGCQHQALPPSLHTPSFDFFQSTERCALHQESSNVVMPVNCN